MSRCRLDRPTVHVAIKGRAPGQWWPTSDGSAILYCPDCSKPMSLARHRILPWEGPSCGRVNSFVMCPVPLCMHPTRGRIALDLTLAGWAENDAKNPELNRLD